MKDFLAKRQVNPEHYYRLNVNVGVGEFGMNEWNRLAEISTNTRMYLADKDVQSKSLDASAKLARIHLAKLRWDRAERAQLPFGNKGAPTVNPWDRPLPAIPDASPIFAELPAEEVDPNLLAQNQHHPAMLAPSHARRPSANDKYMVVQSDQDYPEHISSLRHSGEWVAGDRRSDEMFSTAPEVVSSLENSPRLSFERPHSTPPPRPPKTPLQSESKLHAHRMSGLHGPPMSPPPNSALPRPPPGAPLPYPDTDGPPPIVNRSRKPEFSR